MNWTYFLYVLLIGLLDALAMILGKLWFLHKNIFYLLGAFLSLGIAAVFFAFTLKYQNLVIMNWLWIGLSAISGTLAGFLIFKESVSSLQIVGILIVAVGVILLNLK